MKCQKDANGTFSVPSIFALDFFVLSALYVYKIEKRSTFGNADDSVRVENRMLDGSFDALYTKKRIE